MSSCVTISLINRKGGVGKTTITHHLGTGLLHLEEKEQKKYLGDKKTPRVLLVDNDSQGNLSISCLGVENYLEFIDTGKLGSIVDLYMGHLESGVSSTGVESYIMKWQVKRTKTLTYPTIDLIPANRKLEKVDPSIAVHKWIKRDDHLSGFTILDSILAPLKDKYDYIFIDCPPNFSYTTQNAIYASDYYIMTAIPDVLSTHGLYTLTDEVQELNAFFAENNPEYVPVRPLGIILNNVYERKLGPKASQRNIMSRLYEAEGFGDMVFQNHLVYGDGISVASQLGTPVYSVSKGKKQAKALQNILCEMLERIRGDAYESKRITAKY